MSVKRQQGSVDQMDLFDEALKARLRHGVTGKGGTGAGTREERQAPAAWDQDRALTRHLMERVASSANLNQAYKRVKANGGAPGVDGMTVADLRPWIAENRERLIASLLDGSYRPKPVHGVEIPKPGGGMRQLGIPTVVDRLVQQAIAQVLEPVLDPTFSVSSFGFRPGRGAHDALRQAQKYVADGYGVVVDLDLEKFFDSIPHERLMKRVRARIGDGRMLDLLEGWLKQDIMSGMESWTPTEGTPHRAQVAPCGSAPLTRDSLEQVVASLNPVLRGWFEYFKHAHYPVPRVRPEGMLQTVGRVGPKAAARLLAQAGKASRLWPLSRRSDALDQRFLRGRRAVRTLHGLAGSEMPPMRKPPTGELCAGKPHARFGGRGGGSRPYPYRERAAPAALHLAGEGPETGNMLFCRMFIHLGRVEPPDLE